MDVIICRLITDSGYMSCSSCGENETVILKTPRAYLYIYWNIFRCTHEYQIIYFLQDLKFINRSIYLINKMLMLSYIILEILSSTFVSDVYVLMRHILYLIFATPYCNVTVTLVQHCII